LPGARVGLAVALSGLLGVCPPCVAQAPAPGTPATETVALRHFLVAFLRRGSDASTRYSVGLVRGAGGATEEIVVYVTGTSWCGSGGCTVLVLQPHDSSYQLIGDIPIVWPPICALHQRTNGRRDLVVWIRGGGIIPGYRAVITFNGRRYPDGPTGPSAHRLTGTPATDTLIAGRSPGELLFP